MYTTHSMRSQPHSVGSFISVHLLFLVLHSLHSATHEFKQLHTYTYMHIRERIAKQRKILFIANAHASHVRIRSYTCVIHYSWLCAHQWKWVEGIEWQRVASKPCVYFSFDFQTLTVNELTEHYEDEENSYCERSIIGFGPLSILLWSLLFRFDIANCGIALSLCLGKEHASSFCRIPRKPYFSLMFHSKQADNKIEFSSRLQYENT